MESKAIHRYGRDGEGKQCSEGYFAVSPRGELVLIPPTAELADGWQLATPAVVFANGAERAARAANWGEYKPHPEDPPRVDDPKSPNYGNRIS